MTDTKNIKEDPISETLYDSVEKAEKVSGRLFWVVAGLSLLLVMPTILKSTLFTHPIVQQIFSFILFLNILAIIAAFFLNLIIRFYLFRRAEDARRKDFISDVFKVQLTHIRTKGYYNNEGNCPSIRMALSALENLLYTKEVLKRMITKTRTKVFVWIILFIAIILIRTSSLELIYVISLAVFSENIVEKWVRMEWLLIKVEKLYEDTHRVLYLNLSENELLPHALNIFLDYETVKATASILSSSKVFNKLVPSLDEEWKEIKTNLSRA